MDSPLSTSTGFDVNATGPGLAAGVAASAAPTQPNEAGTAAHQPAMAVEGAPSPRLVIRGESSGTEITSDTGERYLLVLSGGRLKPIAIPEPLSNGVAAAALVDYLNCTFPLAGRFALGEFFNGLFTILGKAFAPAVDRKKGLHGYRFSFDLGDTSAKFAYGGNRDTGLLTFPGDACHQIRDWEKLVAYLRDSLNAHLTRLDLAADDFEGRHSVDDAVELYRAGLFNAGGRKPKISQRGNWLEPDGTGRTFYIGKRDSGKLLRVYEKGMQFGIPWHPWTRTEVEFHNVDRIIPWEAVLAPGKYLAGAYPKALGWISEEQSRIRTLQHTASAGYEALNHWHSVAYGKHLDVMMAVEGSADKVIDKLRRHGFPARLDLPPLPGIGKVFPPCEP